MSDGISENAVFWALIASNGGLFVASAILISGLIGEYTNLGLPKSVRIGRWSFTKFEFMVVAGVVGELFFNALIFTTSITLEVLHSTAERQAKSEIAATNERTAILETNLETLRNENLQLRRSLTATDTKQAELLRRRITDPMRSQFLPLAKTLPAKDEDRPVVFSDSDDDGAKYAADIVTLLRLAGFTKAYSDAWHGSPPVKPGVTMCLRNEDDVRIFDALKQAKIATDSVKFTPGISSAPETQPDLRESHPFFCENGSIFIGLKPAVD